MTPDLQLSAPGGSWTFAHKITGGGSGCVIEKTGTGKVTLNPSSGSTFIGSAAAALTVTQGTLQLVGRCFQHAAFGLRGGRRVVCKHHIGRHDYRRLQRQPSRRHKLQCAPRPWPNWTFNGPANLIGHLGNTPTAAPPIAVTGAVVTAGSNTISVNPTVPSGEVNGVYHFLKFGSLPSPEGLAAFQLAAPSRTMSLQIDGSYLDVNYNLNNFPLWTGANGIQFVGGNNWKVNSQSGSVTDFLAGDNVVFDDTAPGSTTVDISGADVMPSSTTFNNSALSYTLQGANALAGTGGLTKTGTGLLTITNANSFTGAVNLNGGTVSIASIADSGGRTWRRGRTELRRGLIGVYRRKHRQ